LTSRTRDDLIGLSTSRKERTLLSLADRIDSLPRFRRGDAISGGNPVERRLAAILVADVVGYSRLMGIDEVGTLRQLTAHRRECIDPAIAAGRGRIVKTTGDGILAEFPSAVDAVVCAITIQRGLASRNEAVPEEKRLAFRIGINVGDIIIEANDIFGDGVNVAARLEALCEPGGLCISRTVRDQVRDKLPVAFDDLGEQSVKNIARPVRAFGLTPRAIISAPELAPRGGAVPNSQGRHWMIAVLIAVTTAAGGPRGGEREHHCGRRNCPNPRHRLRSRLTQRAPRLRSCRWRRSEPRAAAITSPMG
jgi:class 3 adenylate cyclase